MNRCRATVSGISAGHITPHWSKSASASAALSSAFVVSRLSMTSAIICIICGCCARPQHLLHQVRQPQHELQLDHVLGNHLVPRVQVLVRNPRHVVAALRVAQQKTPAPTARTRCRRTPARPSPRTASQADDRTASGPGRSSHGTGTSAPARRKATQTQTTSAPGASCGQPVRPRRVHRDLVRNRQA